MITDYRENPGNLEEGIFDIPFDEYKKLPALNIHSLQHMRKTPAHFRYAMEQPDTGPSPDMIVGQCFDLALLNPGRFAATVVPDTGENKNSNAWKDWKAEQDRLGHTVLPTKGSSVTIADIRSMVTRVRKKESALELLAAGFPQKTVIWFDREWEIWCKGRPDWLTPDAVVVDVKKARDAGFFGFTKQAYRLGYYWQAAWYLRGMTQATNFPHTEFRFLVCEDTGPLESQVFRPNEAQLDNALARIEEAVRQLLVCLDTGDWPGYPDFVMDMDSGQEAFQEYLSEDEFDDITI